MARNELVAKIAHDIAEKNRLMSEHRTAVVELDRVRKEA
jgi:hypothetical protein